MEARRDGSLPHSVKRWQLNGTDYDRKAVRTVPLTLPSPAKGPSDTRLSAWTPLVHKPSNQQLFEERSRLVLHWFDLWSDAQRKRLLRALLTRCSQSQLRVCRDWLMESLPVVRVDFTAALPRFLSLYVMSFLNPRDLSAAAQVSWHWRTLAEQECLWSARCVRRGWFLPYCPAAKQFGAWKDHYVSCVSTLDWSPPPRGGGARRPPARDAEGEEEEEEVEEEKAERRIRQLIRERLQQEKRLRLRTRRPWGSGLPPPAQRGWPLPGGTGSSGAPWLSWRPGPSRSEEPAVAASPLGAGGPAAPSGSLGRSQSEDRLSVTSAARRPCPPTASVPVLLVSNRVPAYELVLCGARAEALPVLYDARGPLPALLAQLERGLAGRRARRLGLLCPGGPEELRLVRGVDLSEREVWAPDTRDFWEKMCGWVVPSEEGGGVDIFSPLAASARGVALMQNLATISGLEVSAPTGLATGSFQNILSTWTTTSSLRARDPLSNRRGPRVEEEEVQEEEVVGVAPALLYVHEGALREWCHQARWMEETLGDIRGLLGSRLDRVSLEARGRALGHFLRDRVRLEDVCVSPALTQALVEGLAALNRRTETRPLQSLSLFLARRSGELEDGENTEGQTRRTGGEDAGPWAGPSPSPSPELDRMALDWRGAVVRELYHSEQQHQARLAAVFKVYHEPLTAAVDSNRPIISHASVHVIFSPVEQILQLSNVFLCDLRPRLASWGPAQCVGDVCLRLCSRLRLYLNYLHNYPTALSSVDECREVIPAFRAFMKRTDRTMATHMLSLPELLLAPAWRLDEYVPLLQSLSLHTPPDHPDHQHVVAALRALTNHREFMHKMKSSSEADMLMEETQRKIQGCPNLCEGDRRLIMTQDAALLESPGEDIPSSLRAYQQACDLGLFLFSDALVLTKRAVRHAPFSLARRSTHTFLASVALDGLEAREITHSHYVQNAFILEGPRRSWACQTERAEDAAHFLSALRLAVCAALPAQS